MPKYCENKVYLSEALLNSFIILHSSNLIPAIIKLLKFGVENIFSCKTFSFITKKLRQAFTL